MNDYMTAAEFERKMKEIQEKYGTDYEGMRYEMGCLILAVLRSRGFDAGCDIYQKVMDKE